jgi:hypothetical protein
MAGYEITAELNLKKIAAEVKEFAKAMNEFAKDLEQIEKKYAKYETVHKDRTVQDFADRCKECGKMKRCKDCRFFEYDSVANVDGIPLIVAHEICSKWGEGCKTSEDGYCFLFEPKEDEN